VFAAIAVAAVIAGGTIAAVTSAQTAGNKPTHHRVAQGLIVQSAAYLGITQAQLRRQLLAGRSLGQIAAATGGRSEAGLIDALERARKAQLQSASRRLGTVITNYVQRPGGPLARPAQVSVLTAARYLGLTRAQLRSELRSGRSLGQIANSTAGRSQAGLIATILAFRKRTIAARVAAHALTPAQARQRLAGAEARIRRQVDRRR